MAGVTIRLEGDTAVRGVLALAARKLANPLPLWEKIGNALVVSTQVRFEREVDPSGNPWPRSIRALLTGGKTLTDTARLRSSLTYEASRTGVAVGTNVIYAAVHQFGATIRAKTPFGLLFKIGGQFRRKMEVTIPRRAFLGLDAEDEAEVIALAEEYLAQSVGAGSGGSSRAR